MSYIVVRLRENVAVRLTHRLIPVTPNPPWHSLSTPSIKLAKQRLYPSMDPLQLLENLSAKDAVEDVVNNRLHGLSNDDRARVLVARGLSIVQVLSRAANQDQFRLACELLKRETVCHCTMLEWAILTLL